MKKIYFAVLSLLLFANDSVGQELSIDNNFSRKKNQAGQSKSQALVSPITPEKCGFNFMMQKARQAGFNDQLFETEIAKIIERRRSEGGASFTGPVTIPVIFHVIYRNSDGGTPSSTSANLSLTQLQAQVAQLNLDYRNMSGSAYSVAADVQINFCLALVDTAGRPLEEPGINRINGQTRVPAFSNTNTMNIDVLYDYFESTIKPGTIWDPSSYLNIWTAAMTNSGLLGYATFPGLSGLPGLDNSENNTNAGVVLNWESIGSVASPGVDAAYGYGRTLTHEAGHFFGLRHIWGDGTCGNDYCLDTPPQDDATIGCPTPGTLNNCTPSLPKMFENYMDYSFDACLNTFTLNQAQRCQTVLDNSPRRLSLISSKACQARAGNAIGFIYAGEYSASETGPAGACPNNRSYAFRIYPSVQATGNATVTFSSAGSTATLNRDFTISPSSVSFVAGETAPKTIIVTVIDDQEKENTEKIVIGYTISGSGVVAGPDKQTLTIQIADDDAGTIQVDATNPVKTILSENFNASVNIPAGWSKQTLGDGVTIPNEWVVSANGGGSTTGNAAHITSDVVTKPNTYNNANESDSYLFTPLLDATGLKNINLTFYWRVLGETDWDEGYIGYIPEGQALTPENVLYFNTRFVANSAGTTSSLNLPASMADKKFYFVFNWYNDNTLGSNPGFTIDNVQFTGRAMNIASTVGSDTSFTVPSATNLRFYSVNTVSPFESRVIADMNNASADLGCITANVATQGTGMIPITTNAGSFHRSEKTIQLTPATANTTASYQVTLYFTTAELTAWGSAVPGLKLMKVRDGVNLASTLTSVDAQIVTAIVDDQRATRGYASFTGTFSGGFSQFMLVSGSAALPVTLLNFEATAGKTNIALTWKTSMERNNKGFVVERSTNAVDFENIGWVDGVGNSSDASNYHFTDNFVQPNTLYYYRLQQTDIDNRQSLSETRQAKIKDRTSVIVSIAPNPATDRITVFTSGAAGAADINLFDSEGRTIRSWRKVNCSSNPAELKLGNIASGIYLLQVITEGTVSTEKIIIH